MTKYKNIILALTVSCAKNPIKPNCQNVNWIARFYCAFSFLYRFCDRDADASGRSCENENGPFQSGRSMTIGHDKGGSRVLRFF